MRLLRTVGMPLCALVAALILVAPSAARADTGFFKAWGFGVSTGARQFETCTATCHASLGFGLGEPGELWYPEGAAVSAAGNVLVANTDFNRIEVFSGSGSFIRAFGGGVAGGAGLQVCTTTCTFGSSGGGAGELAKPWGVATDASGDVVVADSQNHRVSVFTETGTFVRSFGWGVSTGANALEVCTSNCRAGIPGTAAGQLDTPRALALDGAGHVLVADDVNDRVEEYDLGGAYVRSFGAGQMSNPLGIAVGSSGDVFVSDNANHRVDVFSPSGAFVRMFGWGVNTGAAALETCTSGCRAGISGAGAGQMSYPAGLVVDAAGRVLVSDNVNGRINVYTESGAFVRSVGSAGTGAGQLAGAAGLAVDGAGRVFAADTYNQRVDVFGYQFPTISPSQASVAFGTRTTGTTSPSTTVTLTNGGDVDLSIASLTITGGGADQFARPAGSAGGTCDTTTPIAPAASCTVKLVFAPTTGGAKSATLAIAGNTQSGTGSVALSGTGDQPTMGLDQTALAFGDEPVNSTYGVRSFTVTNTSSAQLILTSLSLAGPDAADFWGVDDGAIGHCSSSTVLLSGESCAIWVIFTPRSAGAKTASLSIASNASLTPSLVPLSGTGTQSAYEAPQNTVPSPAGADPPLEAAAPTEPVAAGTSARPRLAKAGAPSAKARGTGVSVDPGVVLTCAKDTVRCTTKVTATAQVPVTGRKGRTKKVVVGRASITTRQGATARIVFSLTSQGARTLRKVGRLRLSVVAVSTAAGGATSTLSATVSVKRPGKA